MAGVFDVHIRSSAVALAGHPVPVGDGFPPQRIRYVGAALQDRGDLAMAKDLRGHSWLDVPGGEEGGYRAGQYAPGAAAPPCRSAGGGIAGRCCPRSAAGAGGEHRAGRHPGGAALFPHARADISDAGAGERRARAGETPTVRHSGYFRHRIRRGVGGVVPRLLPAQDARVLWPASSALGQVCLRAPARSHAASLSMLKKEEPANVRHSNPHS